MSIHKYTGEIFTHGGQTTVDGFGIEIATNFGELLKVSKLVVYAGYHGNTSGDWCRDFTHSEVMKTMRIKRHFAHAILRLVKKPGMTDLEIRNAVERGRVFFTWCDSDNKVKAVMGASMPTQLY